MTSRHQNGTLFEQLMRAVAFRVLGWVALLSGAAGCGSRQRAEVAPARPRAAPLASQRPAEAPVTGPRAPCLLCNRKPSWHEEVPSQDPHCSGTTLHKLPGWGPCQQVARTRIARTAKVYGLTSNEAFALYQGVHRVPLSWIDDPELYCPSPGDASSTTVLEVTVRPSTRCSEQQACDGDKSPGSLYLPVIVELRTQDGRLDERFESFLNGGSKGAQLSDGYGHYGLSDGQGDQRKEMKIIFEHDGRQAKLHGYIEGWGPRGHFPTACWHRCQEEPKLEQVSSRLPPAQVFALLSRRLAPKTPQRGFPIRLELSLAGQHACLPRPDQLQGEPASTYFVPTHAVLRATDGAQIARFPVEIAVRPDACATCPSVSLRGGAVPLEYPPLVAQDDGTKVSAHVILELETQGTAGAAQTRGKLRLSYIDRHGAERVEAYALEALP
jgi:hypothetical protein